MATNNKEYMKRYQRQYRKGVAPNMIENIYKPKLNTKITTSQIKKIYKDKITTDDEQVLLNSALVIVELIETSRKCLEQEGVYIKTVTGLIKENPSQKAIRDNLKALTSILNELNTLIISNKENEPFDLEKWLDSE